MTTTLKWGYCECGCKCYVAEGTSFHLYWDLKKTYTLYDFPHQSKGTVFTSKEAAEEEAQRRYDAEHQAWRPIDEAPKDGSEVDLWLGAPWNERRASMVWFEPWGNWIPKSEVDFLKGNFDSEEIEIFGVGSAIPTHFMVPPRPPV